jgi:pyridoxine 4-dehydrogenase
VCWALRAFVLEIFTLRVFSSDLQNQASKDVPTRIIALQTQVLTSALCPCDAVAAIAIPQEGNIMSNANAAKSGTFKIGGDIKINRLGFGAMRITGRGIWGEPADRAEAIRTLKRLPDLGVDFIDTADSYGPDVSEQIIREALHPYDKILVATKGGLTRPGPDQWVPRGRPEYLIEQAHKSCRQLGVEQIGLWQLHRIDPKTPRDEQFGAIKSLLDAKIIAHAGLSEVSVEDIKAASKVFKVATVQNRYNLVDRTSEDVLDYCAQQGIGFIPWFPLAAGDLAKPGSLLDSIAKHHNAGPSQIALAWILKRSPVMLPIPGTSKVSHLEENIAAVNITLSDDEFAALDREGRAGFRRARGR